MSTSPCALIVYSSLSGNTKEAANIIQEELIKAGFQVVVESIQCPQVKQENEQKMYSQSEFNKFRFDVKAPVNDPRQFPLVLFGGPVWWYHLSPAVSGWIKQAKFDKLSTFGTFQQCGSEGYKEAFADVEQLLGTKAEKVVIFDNDHKKTKGGMRDKLTNFVQTVVTAYKATH
ncbi:MAG: hypothetical protein EZS28_030028 [Streblomastix strix]|uniref:Flavodoxin n=1 Tax=Streblomastix strix TaxID=222440 RepID=A0A5J4UVV1_9EUKA|nr:MAG: hypothetical protein EZS28_030028 [Streblomastix strix]